MLVTLSGENSKDRVSYSINKLARIENLTHDKRKILYFFCFVLEFKLLYFDNVYFMFFKMKIHYIETK